MGLIAITKRATGGLKVVMGGKESHYSRCDYGTHVTKIYLYDPAGNTINSGGSFPSEWTIDGVTGLATVEEVSRALDLLGLDPGSFKAAQPSVFSPIPDLATQNFDLGGRPFLVVNDNEEAVILNVIPAGAPTDVYVPKKIYPEDNSYLIRGIEANAVLTALQISNLIYAY